MVMRADNTGTEDLVADGEAPEDVQVSLSPEDKDTLANEIGKNSFFEGNDDDVDEDHVDEAAAAEAKAKLEAEDVDDDEGDEDEDEDEEAEEGSAVEGEEKPEPTPDTTLVPNAYRRSLKAMQWSDDEIDKFAVADPEVAMKTFERIHSSRVAQIQEFSQLGRDKQNAQRTATETGSDIRSAAASATVAGIDLSALDEEFGEENVDLVSKIFKKLSGPLDAALERVNAALPVIESGVRSAKEAEMATTQKVIDTFFGSKDLEAYVEFYGDPTKGRTNVESDRYLSVLDEAGAILTGAELQGRRLSNEDALEAAHASVSSDFRVTAIRKSIKKTVKKRAAGVTLKPGSRGKSKTAARGPAKNRAEAIAKVQEGLLAAIG